MTNEYLLSLKIATNENKTALERLTDDALETHSAEAIMKMFINRDSDKMFSRIGRLLLKSQRQRFSKDELHIPVWIGFEHLRKIDPRNDGNSLNPK
jgi:hypothetical protein